MSGNQRRKIRPTCLQKGGTGKISVPPTQVGQIFGWDLGIRGRLLDSDWPGQGRDNGDR